jgi:hypothetical protein
LIKVGSKSKCKIGTCIVAYYAKWLLTKHLKKVHGLLKKKAKNGRLSIFEKGPQHQNHVKMNARILRDAMTHPKLFDRLNYKSKGEDNEKKRSWNVLPNFQHFEGRRACWSSGMGLGRLTSNSITHTDLHKPNNKLVNA